MRTPAYGLENKAYNSYNEEQGNAGNTDEAVPYPRERPALRPRQIVSPAELQPGMLAERVHEGNEFCKPFVEKIGVLAVGVKYKGSLYGVLPERSALIEDSGWMIVARQRGNRVIPAELSLRDMSVLPYVSTDDSIESWNPSNYLRHPQEVAEEV